MSVVINIIGCKYLVKLYICYVFLLLGSNLSISDFYYLFMQYYLLIESNIYVVLLVLGLILVVIEGVIDIEGVFFGMYRDGGIIDYYFDIFFGFEDGLVLYFYFYNKLISGWFDKGLKCCVFYKSSYDNVVMMVFL